MKKVIFVLIGIFCLVSCSVNDYNKVERQYIDEINQNNVDVANSIMEGIGLEPNNYSCKILDVTDDSIPNKMIYYYFENCDYKKYTKPVFYKKSNEYYLVHLIRENEAIIHKFTEIEKANVSYIGDIKYIME